MASRDNNLRTECFRGPVSSVSSEGLLKRTHSRRPSIRMPIDRRRLLQAIAILGAICAYTTIVLGGTVRGMGAGLACPDWPLCNGHVVPDLGDPLVAVEYAHRLVAALTTLFLLATFAVSVLWFRPDLRLVAFSFTSVGFLVAQVGLGALTITSSLDWVIVTMHLALGTATFASSLLVAFLALRPSSPDLLYRPTAE